MAQLSDVRPAGGLVSPLRALGQIKPGVGTFVISVLLLALGFYIVLPIVILIVMSFNEITRDTKVEIVGIVNDG